MKLIRIVFSIAVSLHLAIDAWGQGFVNLNFETTTITPVVFPGGTRYVATVPGWIWTPGGNFVNGDPNSVGFNDIALDSAAVNLEGTNYFSPYSAIQGNYSILLQGGDLSYQQVYNTTNGSSIGQTGQVPLYAKSITYWGGMFQVSFNGQSLPLSVLNITDNYPVWGADISAYAGQTGQLLFTCPGLTAGLLDNIQFSSTAVPEPSFLNFASIFILLICWRNNRSNAQTNSKDVC